MDVLPDRNKCTANLFGRFAGCVGFGFLGHSCLLSWIVSRPIPQGKGIASSKPTPPQMYVLSKTTPPDGGGAPRFMGGDGLATCPILARNALASDGRYPQCLGFTLIATKLGINQMRRTYQTLTNWLPFRAILAALEAFCGRMVDFLDNTFTM